MDFERGRRIAAKVWAAVDVVATLAVIAIAGMLVWRPWTPSQTATATAGSVRKPIELPKERIILDMTTVKGSAAAKVALVAYSDFECPYCRRFSVEVLPGITKKYVDSGRLLVSFRHFPLERIHRQAFRLAESAECAGLQGQFWAMHDLQFASPEASTDLDHVARAGKLGLNIAKFNQCLRGEVRSKIRNQADEARAFGLRSTPTVFVGLLDGDKLTPVRAISGAKPIGDFVAAIDETLGQQTTRK